MFLPAATGKAEKQKQTEKNNGCTDTTQHRGKRYEE